MLNVYGADFSGAMNPKIFYAHGVLAGSHLTLKSTVECDDRLDLYKAIVRSVNAIWGLDFPFAIPSSANWKLGFHHRNDMLYTVSRMTRKEFAKYVAFELSNYPRKCVEHDTFYCRHTDIAVHAHSVFKKVNPNLRVMLYAGLKLILYLAESRVNVYPFNNLAREEPVYDESFATVYEVYPSYAWDKVGMKRSLNIDEFITRFNDLNLITVENELDVTELGSQDLADSIVACVMLAAAYVTQDMKNGWDYRLPIFTEDEWEWRYIEGLIVRF